METSTARVVQYKKGDNVFPMEVKKESGRVKSDVARWLENSYGIHQLRIGTPIPNLRVNIYFAEKPVPTLIDVPPDERLCLDELNTALSVQGYSVKSIQRIVVSHPHLDHFGGARTIVEMSGAEVWVSERASHQFENYEEEFKKEKAAHTLLLERAGATISEMESSFAFYETRDNLAHNVFPSRRLKIGDRFEFGSLTLTVAAVPGHTPWCILLFDEKKGIAFGGDLFVNSNPSEPLVLVNEERPREYRRLASYKTSLEAVKGMNLKILLPGHGGIIQDPSKKIQDRLKTIDRRRLAILHTLTKRSQTALEITRQLFPNLPQDRLFIGVLDVMSHLELLEADGLVTQGDGTSFRPTIFREVFG
jgi:glyoxylase-like metal-dependent hydrolase (beta-lactamase superfamily II)